MADDRVVYGTVTGTQPLSAEIEGQVYTGVSSQDPDLQVGDQVPSGFVLPGSSRQPMLLSPPRYPFEVPLSALLPPTPVAGPWALGRQGRTRTCCLVDGAQAPSLSAPSNQTFFAPVPTGSPSVNKFRISPDRTTLLGVSVRGGSSTFNLYAWNIATGALSANISIGSAIANFYPAGDAVFFTNDLVVMFFTRDSISPTPLKVVAISLSAGSVAWTYDLVSGTDGCCTNTSFFSFNSDNNLSITPDGSSVVCAVMLDPSPQSTSADSTNTNGVLRVAQLDASGNAAVVNLTLEANSFANNSWNTYCGNELAWDLKSIITTDEGYHVIGVGPHSPSVGVSNLITLDANLAVLRQTATDATIMQVGQQVGNYLRVYNVPGEMSGIQRVALSAYRKVPLAVSSDKLAVMTNRHQMTKIDHYDGFDYPGLQTASKVSLVPGTSTPQWTISPTVASMLSIYTARRQCTLLIPDGTQTQPFFALAAIDVPTGNKTAEVDIGVLASNPDVAIIGGQDTPTVAQYTWTVGGAAISVNLGAADHLLQFYQPGSTPDTFLAVDGVNSWNSSPLVADAVLTNLSISLTCIHSGLTANSCFGQILAWADFHSDVKCNTLTNAQQNGNVKIDLTVAPPANLTQVSENGTVENITLNNGDRVLVNDQQLTPSANWKANGVYVVNRTSGTWDRATDSLKIGSCAVENRVTSGGTLQLWRLTNQDRPGYPGSWLPAQAITNGTDDQEWVVQADLLQASYYNQSLIASNNGKALFVPGRIVSGNLWVDLGGQYVADGAGLSAGDQIVYTIYAHPGRTVTKANPSVSNPCSNSVFALTSTQLFIAVSGTNIRAYAWPALTFQWERSNVATQINDLIFHDGTLFASVANAYPAGGILAIDPSTGANLSNLQGPTPATNLVASSGAIYATKHPSPDRPTRWT